MSACAIVRATPAEMTGSNHNVGLRYVSSKMTITTAAAPNSSELSMPSNALLDSAAFPAGPDHAHTLKNTGSQPLQYVMLSNTNTTDIIGYPDSNKFAFQALPDPTTWPQGMWVKKMIKDQPSVDYFEGEDTSQD